MKIAIVFDDLIQRGGAERLLSAIHEIWPDAPVYTSVASDDWLSLCEQREIILKTSFMQRFPFKKKLNRFYSVFGLHILAFESFDFSGYDIVLSISARYAHGIITKPGTKHICYMNSPGRMFWDPASYFDQESDLVHILRPLIALFLSLTKLWDYTIAQRVDCFIANSEISQQRIRKFYNRTSEIIYPFVEFSKKVGTQHINSPQNPLTANGTYGNNYFVVLTRLLPWKRVDIAVEACKKLKLNLKITGDGPARKKLEKVADGSHNIEFLGYVNEDEKWQILANCRALILTQAEDFGIASLEAMSVGKPVVAFRAGGALTTVVEGSTGEFFDEQTVESLCRVLKIFDKSRYASDKCRAQVLGFSEHSFVASLKNFIDNVYSKNA